MCAGRPGPDRKWSRWFRSRGQEPAPGRPWTRHGCRTARAAPARPPASPGASAGRHTGRARRSRRPCPRPAPGTPPPSPPAQERTGTGKARAPAAGAGQAGRCEGDRLSGRGCRYACSGHRHCCSAGSPLGSPSRARSITSKPLVWQRTPAIGQLSNHTFGEQAEGGAVDRVLAAAGQPDEAVALVVAGDVAERGQLTGQVGV
jgi:hypothetical protein